MTTTTTPVTLATTEPTMAIQMLKQLKLDQELIKLSTTVLLLCYDQWDNKLLLVLVMVLLLYQY
jgi:hypothetical protein